MSLNNAKPPPAVLLFAIALLVSCDKANMRTDSKIRPLGQSPFFANQAAARPAPDGTIAQGHLELDTGYYKGIENHQWLNTIPIPITQRNLARGRERFNVYCAVCHGETGHGNGMIPARGFKTPPDFHDPSLRNAPPGRIFSAMTNGFGGMYDVADRVSVEDRWKIAAYVKTLQLSQDAPPQALATDATQPINPQ